MTQEEGASELVEEMQLGTSPAPEESNLRGLSHFSTENSRELSPFLKEIYSKRKIWDDLILLYLN